jgi:hypothetical protein
MTRLDRTKTKQILFISDTGPDGDTNGGDTLDGVLSIVSESISARTLDVGDVVDWIRRPGFHGASPQTQINSQLDPIAQCSCRLDDGGRSKPRAFRRSYRRRMSGF